MTDQIIQFVTERTGVTYEQMKSPRRHREWVQARQAAMWLLNEFTELSLKSIGQLFGGRDHSTVFHAIECVNDSRTMKWDKRFSFLAGFDPIVSSDNLATSTEIGNWSYVSNREEYNLLEVCG